MTAGPNRRAVVIGAGPAGLTAAFELLERTDVVPLVLEASPVLGGLARTVEHHGNRIDIGGHRFFSKSERVMRWWTARMPIEGSGPGGRPDPGATDRVLLVRERRSRIYYGGKLFDYPIRLTPRTLRDLGLRKIARLAASYAAARLKPRPERSLEDFFINRFGAELYAQFFRDYTEKVWGVPCTKIAPEWGAQRVKGLSVTTALTHALRSALGGDRSLAQQGTETSLIERFLYPKLGPGQLWELVGDEIRRRGGEIQTEHAVVEITLEGNRVTGVVAEDARTGRREEFRGDYVFSTLPVRELFACIRGEIPPAAREAAAGLRYRHLITVGLLLRRLRLRDLRTGEAVRDTWIYVQEPNVQVGRLQLYNNWSPYLVADPGTVWVGLEYFCGDGDALWSLPDDDLAALAARELNQLGVAGPADVLDAVVLRAPRAYPAYTGSYSRFGEIRRFTDGVENLFLIGRNGMHRYNNQDHSMLTAMLAVDAVVAGLRDRSPIWAVNAEQDYHEAT